MSAIPQPQQSNFQSKNSPVQYRIVHDQVHQRALLASENFRRSEADLISALEEVETHKVYLRFGYSSLFMYGVRELKLSENVVYSLITVMRKSKEVPELKNQIRDGLISLGHAKRIAPVLNSENSKEWLEKAATLTQRQLEKEVVKIRPLGAVQERASYVAENRVKLEVGLSETQMLQLRKVQDLVCQSKSKHASIEETLMVMTEFYLKHRDPVAKAKRVTVKKGSMLSTQVSRQGEPDAVTPSIEKDGSHSTRLETSLLASSQVQAASDITASNLTVSDKSAFSEVNASRSTLALGKTKATEANNNTHTNSLISQKTVTQYKPVHLVTEKSITSNAFKNQTSALGYSREPIPAAVLHAVHLRDQRKCTYLNPEGRPCGQTRWVEVHHVKPVSEGGANTLQNLVTLCSGHHRMMHSRQRY